MAEACLRVLIIDDEPAIRRFLRTALMGQGYSVFEASTGRDGIAAVINQRPDLIILDLGLPDVDGAEVTRQLREWTNLPILVLSVREAESDKIEALDAGADDYLTKPFGLGELLARMRVLMRRSGEPDAPVVQTGALTIDLSRRLVTVGNAEIALTPTEYDILRVLAAHPGRVLTHGQLLRQVWGTSYESDLHILRVNISNLRRKIEADPAQPAFVQTELGVGYRLRMRT